MTWILGVSIIGLTALAVYRFAKRRRLGSFLVQLSSLAIVLLFLHIAFGFPVPATVLGSRGAEASELPIIVVLFVCMLMGMLAHWLYGWLETPRRERPPFDFGLFAAPVLASPIVFIPLLASLQSANLDLMRFDIPRFMLFLVAFENGFFWKEYFDNRRKKASQ